MVIADGDPEKKGRHGLTATIKFPLCMMPFFCGGMPTSDARAFVEVDWFFCLLRCRGPSSADLPGFVFVEDHKPQTTDHKSQTTRHTHTHTRHHRQVLAGGNTDDEVDGGGGHGLQCRVIRVMGIGMYVLRGLGSFSGCGSRGHLVTTYTRARTKSSSSSSSSSTAWIISTVTTKIVGPQWRVAGGAGH